MTPLILASVSPRRRRLLEQIGVPFQVMVSQLDEELPEGPGHDPVEVCRRLALLKAEDVAARLAAGLVVGADTVVCLDDLILGKPADDREALEMLLRLNGRTHQVVTAVAVVDAGSGRRVVDYQVTSVTMGRSSQARLQSYVSTGEPRGKAGAYAIQGRGALLVESIEGCYFNVVGLPLGLLDRMLAGFDLQVLG